MASEPKVSRLLTNEPADQPRHLDSADGGRRSLGLEAGEADRVDQYTGQRGFPHVFTGRPLAGVHVERNGANRDLCEVVPRPRWALADFIRPGFEPGLVSYEAGALLQRARQSDYGGVVPCRGRLVSERSAASMV